MFPFQDALSRPLLETETACKQLTTHQAYRFMKLRDIAMLLLKMSVLESGQFRQMLYLWTIWLSLVAVVAVDTIPAEVVPEVLDKHNHFRFQVELNSQSLSGMVGPAEFKLQEVIIQKETENIL